MRPYPAYKDSGVEWFPEIPDHWDVWKLAHAVPVISSGTTPSTENPAYYSDGKIPWVNTGDLNDATLQDCAKRVTELAVMDHSPLKLYPIGSVVIALYGATIGKLGILGLSACVNQACCVLTPSGGIDSRFLFFWLLGFRNRIITLASGGGQPNISQEIVRSLRLALPPFPEQQAIARFLDGEVAKIDALVAEQRRLIALLAEKRQAVISHAVTKGLNPATPLKPSGIDWLGDIPEGWEVVPLRRLIGFIEAGTSVNATDISAGPAERGVLKTSCVYSGTFAPEENKTVIPEEFDRVSCPLIAGTLIVSRMNTPDLVGAAGYVREAPDNLFLPDRLWQVHLTDSIPEFVHFWTMTEVYRGQVKVACAGTSSSMQNLTQDDFRSFRLAVPPTDEQQAIVAHLKSDLPRFDALTAAATSAISLLQERRAALISAAVTGKIDLRPHFAQSLSEPEIA